MMRRLLIAAVLATGLFHGNAQAQRVLEYSTNYMYRLCSGGPTPVFTYGSNDPHTTPVSYTSQHSQADWAMRDAMSMIPREGVWSKTISHSSLCRSWDPDWFDGSEEKFENWYESSATVQDWCDNPNAGGCASYDFQFPGFTDILASDLAISYEVWYGVINQDTTADYLENSEACQSSEALWLHELGHSYGLEHNDSQIGQMNEGLGCQKNFNLVRDRSDSFWPVDTSGLRSRYEVGSSSSRRNYSASAFYRHPMDGDKRDNDGIILVSALAPTVVVPINYSFQRSFAGSATNVIVQMRWIPDYPDNAPTFNPSTNTYTWPANTSTNTARLDVPSGGGVDSATTRPYNLTVTRSEIPTTGLPYRLWMHVDFSNTRAETDEGDNMIPMPYIVIRWD